MGRMSFIIKNSNNFNIAGFYGFCIFSLLILFCAHYMSEKCIYILKMEATVSVPYVTKLKFKKQLQLLQHVKIAVKLQKT